MSWIIILVGAYVALVFYVRLNERRFIYYPHRNLDATPAQHGWAYEDVTLTTDDDVSIHGWFIPAAAVAHPGETSSAISVVSRTTPDHGGGPLPSTALRAGTEGAAFRPDEGGAWRPVVPTVGRSEHGTPRSPPGEAGTPTLLVLHGNAGNISHRLEKLAIFRELGFDALAMDYRGYGRSEGKPSEAGLYADARAAYQHLVGRRGVPPARVFLYGESLGAAVAVHLATEVDSGGVIIEEAFTSAVEVGQKMFPILPVRLVARSRFDTLGKIGRLRAPLLVLHSREDEMFPLSYAERLLAAAPPPKELVLLQGSHNDAFLTSEPIYREALRRFIAARTGADGRLTAPAPAPTIPPRQTGP